MPELEREEGKLSREAHSADLGAGADFKLSNVHKHILKTCRGGRFSLEDYREDIAKKLKGKELEREIHWKRSSCEKLVKAGLFEKEDENVYRLTAEGALRLDGILGEKKRCERQKTGSFEPGQNHRYLLKFEKGGVLDFKDVEERISKLPPASRARELAMKKGMLKKLVSAGYLEKIDGDGKYRLSEKAFDFLKEKPLKKAGKRRDESSGAEAGGGSGGSGRPEASGNEIKITKYDLDNIVAPAKEGVLGRETLALSPKRLSVEKRIKTLTGAGLLVETEEGWKITEKLLEKVKEREKINLEKLPERKHDFRFLTEGQKKTVSDLKDFLNISGSQILKHIYDNDRKLYESDVRYLIDKEIIKKDKRHDIYVLTPKGIKLASELTGDHDVFKSKIYSRREELRHDTLLYSAYKDVEKELSEQGKIITAIKTDRKLRSEDMKNKNAIAGEYPDLRVEYKDKKTGEHGFLNVEIDLGYSENEIGKKLGIQNLIWFTNSKRQRDKALKKARYLEVRIIDDRYWRR